MFGGGGADSPPDRDEPSPALSRTPLPQAGNGANLSVKTPDAARINIFPNSPKKRGNLPSLPLQGEG